MARSDGDISQATLDAYFTAADGIIVPYSSVGLKQVVTCVAVAADGTTSIAWSRGYNGGTPYTVSATYPLPTAMTDISRDNWVIVSEASYSYRPLLGMVITNAIALHRESYYLPRFGALINITS